MKISDSKCVKDIKCNNCGITLKEDKDCRYSIVGKYSKKELIFCSDCFVKLKREISEMWIGL